MMNGHGKSDRPVVPAKSPNNAGGPTTALRAAKGGPAAEGTVSGVGGDVPPPKTDRAPEYDQKTRQRAGPLQDAAETRQTEWRPAVHAPSLNHNDAKKRTDGAT